METTLNSSEEEIKLIYAQNGRFISDWQARLQSKTLAFQNHSNSKNLAEHLFPLQNNQFLNSTNPLSAMPPGEFRNAINALELIIEKKDQKWGVYFDYDCDGNASGAITSLALQTIGIKNFEMMSPNRKEGFGLKKERIEQLAASGVQNLIVLDNGTEATELVAYAKSLGINEVIIFDHHLARVGHKFPDAILVNENQPEATECEGEKVNSALVTGSLTGIVFGYLFPEFYKSKTGSELLDAERFKIYKSRIELFAGIAVVADVGNLSHPYNRYLLAKSLVVANQFKIKLDKGEEPGEPVSWGFEYLRRFFELKGVTASHYGFKIGAAINGASRMGFPDLGCQLLLETNRHKARELGSRILTLLDERKRLVAKAMKELRPVAEKFFAENPFASVFMHASENFPKEIVGILAGRIKQEYGVTAIIGHKEPETTTWSIRAQEGVDFYKNIIDPILCMKTEDKSGVIDFSDESIDLMEYHEDEALSDEEIADVILKAGGHKVAAGMTTKNGFEQSIYKDFEKRLVVDSVRARAEHPFEYVDEITIDEILDPQKLKELFEILNSDLYGQGNPAPVFRLANVRIAYYKTMGGAGEHLKCCLVNEDGSKELKDATAFFETHSSLGKIIREEHFVQAGDDKFAKLYDVYFTPAENKHGKTDKLSAQISKVIDTGRTVKVEPELIVKQLLEEPKIDLKEATEILQSEVAKIKKGLSIDPEKILRHPTVRASINKLLGHTEYDTETTGLKVSEKNPVDANAILQIAALKIVELTNIEQDSAGSHYYTFIKGKRYKAVKVGSKFYTITTFNQRIYPTTPAEYEFRNGDEVEYDRSKHEYKISQQALGVTDTRLLRETSDGPIAGIEVAGIDQQDIGYPEEVAQEFLDYVGNDEVVAYNAVFDNPALTRLFDNLIEATKKPVSEEEFKEAVDYLVKKDLISCKPLTADDKIDQIPYRINRSKIGNSENEAAQERLELIDRYLNAYPQLQIHDDKVREKYNRKLNGFAERFYNSKLHEQLSNPAKWKCLFLNYLVDLGEKESNRLDDAARDYGADDFARDDFQHDALEDIMPYLIIAAKQITNFSWPTIPNFLDLWTILINQRHNGDKIVTESIDKDSIRGPERKGDIVLQFPAAYQENLQLAYSFQLFESLYNTFRRNSSSSLTGVRSIDKQTGRIVLQGYKDESAKTLQYIALLKKDLFINFLQNSFKDFAGNNLIEKITFYDSTSKVNITFSGEGSERSRTIQHVPLGSLRKSSKYLLDRAEKYKTKPEILKNNIELLKVISDYPRVGIAILTDAGLAIRGYQRKDGELLLKPPATIEPGEMLDEITNNLSFLLNYATIPGMASTTRQFDAHVEEEADELEQLQFPFAKAGKTVIHLHSDYQTTSSIGEMEAALFTLYMRKFSEGNKNCNWDEILAGKSHTFKQGAELKKSNGEYLITGSINQLREIQPVVRNVCWLLYQIKSLPGVDPALVRLNGNQIVIDQPNGIERNIFYILDSAHIEFTAEKTRFVLNANRLLADPFHYSSEINKEKHAIKEAQVKIRTAGSLEKTWLKLAGKWDENLYKDQETADMTLDALVAGDLVNVKRSKSDKNLWLSSATIQHLKFDREASEPELFITDEGKIDLINSSLVDAPALTPDAEITDPELLYWLTKTTGAERIGSNVAIVGREVFVEVNTIYPFAHDKGIDEAEIEPNYPALFKEIITALRSSELNDTLDISNEVGQADIEVHGAGQKQAEFKRGKRPFDVDIFATEAELFAHGNKIVKRLVGSKITLSDMMAECDSFTDSAKLLHQSMTAPLFDVIERLLILEHELELQKRKANLPTHDEDLQLVSQIAREMGNVDFMRHKVLERAGELSERIDGKNERANSLRKAILDFYIATAAFELARIIDALVEINNDETDSIDLDLLPALDKIAKRFEADLKDVSVLKNNAKKIKEFVDAIEDIPDLAFFNNLYNEIESYLEDFYGNYAETAPLSDTTEFAVCELKKEKYTKKILYGKIMDFLDDFPGYRSLKSLRGALVQLREEAKDLKLTVDHFGRDTMNTAVRIQDKATEILLHKNAPRLLKETLNDNAVRVHNILQKEGWIKDLSNDGNGNFKFSATDKMLANQTLAAARIAELSAGKEALPDYQIIAVDTGTLLNLLFGKTTKGKEHCGHLQILEILAERKYTKFAFTDRTLAEFLCSALSVRAEDLFVKNEQGQTIINPIWYKILGDRPKVKARLEWLLTMYVRGYADFIQTSIGNDYDEALKTNEKLKEFYDNNDLKHQFNNSEWQDLTREEMLEAFTYNPGLLATLKRQKIGEHLGEISNAHAINYYHDRYGHSADIRVLFEGNDVRGRIIYEYNKKFVERDANHKIDFGNIKKTLPEYNPHPVKASEAAKFNPQYADNLGSGGFTSTGGFLMPFIAAIPEIVSIWEEGGNQVVSIDALSYRLTAQQDGLGNDVFHPAQNRLLKVAKNVFPLNSSRALLTRMNQRTQNSLDKNGDRYDAVKDEDFDEIIPGQKHNPFGYWHHFVEGHISLKDNKQIADSLRDEELWVTKKSKKVISSEELSKQAAQHPQIQIKIAHLFGTDGNGSRPLARFKFMQAELVGLIVKKITDERKSDVEQFSNDRDEENKTYLASGGNSQQWQSFVLTARRKQDNVAYIRNQIEKSLLWDVSEGVEFLMRHGLLTKVQKLIPETVNMNTSILAYMVKREMRKLSADLINQFAGRQRSEL